MNAATECGTRPGGEPVLSMEEALDLLLSKARPIAQIEWVPTIDALGRVLAEPVHSAIDVPPLDNSAMDGYALRVGDVAAANGRLRVTQRIPAGRVGTTLAPGTAARIFTGAPVPDGADTVVIQEVCQPDDDWVQVPLDIVEGANIRRAGEDIGAGDGVLERGTRLLPQHLGLAASVGQAQLGVYRRLRVAVLTSGDELVMPGEPLALGQIYNSNRYALCGLLAGLGCEILDLGIVEDSIEATRDALARGAAESDLVIATGGVSVGEEDHVKPAVAALGELDIWNVAIKPGKPLAFGRIGDTPFIGSPGNPVSLFVTFCLFARPYILRMQGVEGPVVPRRLRAKAAFALDRPVKRREFMRARMTTDAEGEASLSIYPSRSSAVLSSLAWADGLVMVPAGETVEPGKWLDFIPFSELLA